MSGQRIILSFATLFVLAMVLLVLLQPAPPKPDYSDVLPTRKTVAKADNAFFVLEAAAAELDWPSDAELARLNLHLRTAAGADERGMMAVILKKQLKPQMNTDSENRAARVSKRPTGSLTVAALSNSI